MNNKDKDKESFLERILQRKWTYIVLTIVFFAISFLCFKWGHPFHMFNKDYIIDNELFGTFGDFFGGILGTLFTLISVLLVVRTFRHQQVVTKDNQELQKAQQFNDLFFELIQLYQSEVKELNGVLERVVDIQKDDTKEDNIIMKKERIQYNDKDFFDEEKRIIQKKYRHLKSYESNVSKATNYYMLFYTENRSKIAAYFRTLYRIFELIDKSSLINEQRKKEYSKIIRAQLTESELFFLRYNATTIYGNPFITYLNKYNVLKHLPAFELLEFKDWWKNMKEIEREGINIIYFAIRESLKDVFSNNNKGKTHQIIILPSNSKERYHLTSVLVNGYDFSINIRIDKSNFSFSNEFSGLYNMDDKKIQQLLDCFIKEIFLYSNFNQFNKTDEIKTYSDPIITKGSIVEINSGIKNIMNNSLVIKYPNLCPSTK